VLLPPTRKLHREYRQRSAPPVTTTRCHRGRDMTPDGRGLTTQVGYELIGAGMLIVAGNGRGLPFDYDELERALDTRGL
jgi:hypothetical protein